MIRHTTALGIGILGSSIISLPAWIRPLSPSVAPSVDAVTSRLAEPQTYWHLAIVFALVCILCASFLAWNEEREEIERASDGKAPDLDIDIERSYVTDVIDNQQDWDHFIVDIVIVNNGAPSETYDWQISMQFKDDKRESFTWEAGNGLDVKIEPGRRYHETLRLNLWDDDEGGYLFSSKEIKSVRASCADYLGNRSSSPVFKWRSS